MIRLFIALPLPSKISSKLAILNQTISCARAIPEHQLHLTLRFIGEVDYLQFQEIKAGLSELKHPPFTISVKGVGHFPPRGNPKVIWAGIDPQDEVRHLRNRVNKILRQCNVEPKQRKFYPHITLARLKNSSPQKIKNFLELNSLLQSPPFVIDKCCLFSSQLHHDGAKHTIENEYFLR